MLEKMGPRKYVFPVLIVVLIGCAMSLMFYPMLNMSPKALPFAVLSLDAGATTPRGDMNAGRMMADTLITAEVPDGADTAPIAWQLLDSQEAVGEALANNELYGVLTIPEDFTRLQTLAQAGQGDAPHVSVVLDNAKSPMAATQMQAALTAMFDRLQIPADISVINTGSADSAPASPMAGMMSQQIGIMPLMIMSLVGSILLTRIFAKRRNDTVGQQFAGLGKKLGYALGLCLLAAVTVVVMLNTLVGADAPFWTTTIFLWVASFAVTALFIGAFGIAFPLGGAVAFLTVLCGMMTAVLPQEMLPGLWADWIHPWAPQHFIGDGIRDILYRGAELMPMGSGGLFLLGGLGLVLGVLSGVAPGRRGSPEASDSNPADGRESAVNTG